MSHMCTLLYVMMKIGTPLGPLGDSHIYPCVGASQEGTDNKIEDDFNDDDGYRQHGREPGSELDTTPHLISCTS